MKELTHFMPLLSFYTPLNIGESKSFEKLKSRVRIRGQEILIFWKL